MRKQSDITLKPAKTFEEQLDILRGRGLNVVNPEKALIILSRLNYYRFDAYGLTFKQNDQYAPGVTFEYLYRHYEFDRKLRILLMEIIEPIEIAFRTHLAYLIAHKYGVEGYLHSENFDDEKKHESFLFEWNNCLKKSQGTLFVKHHKKRYDNHYPSWVALEVATFGVVSKLFANLKTADKKAIVRDYYSDVYYENLVSWLQGLNLLRNKCAHYSRLFNINLSRRVSLPARYIAYGVETNKLFALIIAIKHLSLPENWRPWLERLDPLIEEHSDIDLLTIGFIPAWREILAIT